MEDIDVYPAIGEEGFERLVAAFYRQRAAAGEEGIIANRGKPVVKLVKADERSEREQALPDIQHNQNLFVATKEQRLNTLIKSIYDKSH